MWRIGLWVVVCGLWIGASNGWAVTPTVWSESTQAQFEKGEPKEVSITSEGSMVLSPARKELSNADSLELLVWTLLKDEQGNLYAGTGNKGKILRIDKKGKQSLFFDSPEVAIHSLAIDGKGNLYAGSSPDGIVYKITPDGSKASTFVAEGNSYIWALAFSSSGKLYAATGERGKLLEVSSKGDFKEIYDASDPHLMCLAADKEGNVYAGSEGSGIIYKFTDKGKVSVLYDTPESEIHCLVLAPDGTLYAGAMSGKDNRRSSSNGPPGASDELEPGAFEAPDQYQQPTPPVAEPGCTIYKIASSGAVSKIWRSSAPQLLSMIMDRKGRLIVGTGDEGKVYMVMPDGKSTLLAKLDEAQPLCLLEDSDGNILVSTGNVGRIYELTSGYAKEGTYESEVHDTVIRSQWGKVSWRADVPNKTKIVLQTRTGNTEEPDDTWSDWSKSLEDAEGTQIPTPPSRFIQYRAKLSSSDASKTPVLWEVRILGLQDNMSPKIDAVTLKPFRGQGEGVPPGIQVPMMPREGPAGKLATIKKGLVIISWQASDPNGDALTYDLYFRGTQEKDWKLLAEKQEKNAYLWDTESCPDGQIEVKVVASDKPDNPSDMALSVEKASEPFYVDKRAPVVSALKIKQLDDRKLQVEGEAEDATSRLEKGAFAVDAGEWQVIFPKDRIFDSKKEAFSFITDALKPGEHTIVVRIADALENVGVAKALYEVK